MALKAKDGSMKIADISPETRDLAAQLKEFGWEPRKVHVKADLDAVGLNPVFDCLPRGNITAMKSRDRGTAMMQLLRMDDINAMIPQNSPGAVCLLRHLGVDVGHATSHIMGETLIEYSNSLHAEGMGREGIFKNMQDVLRRAISIVSTINKAGIWHGDLTFGNIMRTYKGEIMLLDPEVSMDMVSGMAADATFIAYANEYVSKFGAVMRRN